MGISASPSLATVCPHAGPKPRKKLGCPFCLPSLQCGVHRGLFITTCELKGSAADTSACMWGEVEERTAADLPRPGELPWSQDQPHSSPCQRVGADPAAGHGQPRGQVEGRRKADREPSSRKGCRTRRTPSCTCTDIWQRSTRCWLEGRGGRGRSEEEREPRPSCPRGSPNSVSEKGRRRRGLRHLRRTLRNQGPGNHLSTVLESTRVPSLL